MSVSSQPEHWEKWGHVDGLFISCSQVVQRLSTKRGVVEKGPFLNRLPTSYEPFFSPLEFPYSINISTETEEEDKSIYIDINIPMRLWVLSL